MRKPELTKMKTCFVITLISISAYCGLAQYCGNKVTKTRCENWVKSGYCTNARHAASMKRNCALSCGHCVCKDLSTHCKDLANKGECKKDPKKMLLSCQKSCAVCPPKVTKKPAVQGSNQAAGSGAGCWQRGKGTGNPGSIIGSGSPPSATKAPSIVKKTTSRSYSNSIKCGTKALIGRIVGGSKVSPKGWPWQVGIKSCPTCMFFCGGTIVAKRWVITAAHCLVNYRASDLYIEAGVTNQKKISKHKQSFNCTAIHAHQSYAIKAPYDEDIAVLKLNKDVVFNDHVRPLCLNENKLKTTKNCIVTGYGKTSEKGSKSAHLLQAVVPIVDHGVCVKAYLNRTRPRPVTKNMLCAGYAKGGIDACAGDSGGPLTCFDQSKQHYVLGGIVSWGVGCARASTYGVYTEMEHLSAWITRITGTIV